MTPPHDNMDKPIQDEITTVIQKLSILTPTPADAPRPATQALAQIKQQAHIAKQPNLIESLRRIFIMSNRKPIFVVVSLILLFAVAFSFPGVRAGASEFLGIFRVQKFAAISISPEQIAVLEELAESGLTPGEFEMIDEPGIPEEVNNAREASQVAGYDVRTLRTLGAPEVIYVADGGNGRLTIDLEQTRAIMDVVGVEPSLLPDSVDGGRIDVAIYPTVQQTWQDGTMLFQTESPVVDYPDEIDPAVLGKAFLLLFGMEEAEAGRLAASIDWTSTLILPIPSDMATFSEVTIDGVSGLALTSIDGTYSGLVWQKSGMLYMLSAGTGAEADLDLINLASSLR